MEEKLPDNGTVTVACKLPNGIVLRLFNMVERDELVMGGGTRTVKSAILAGEPVTINGCAAPFGSPIVLFGGYALTQNVNAEFFKKWMEQNADSDIVKNNLIFAHTKDSYAANKAKAHGEVLSGLQPLNPDKDIRAPSRIKTANLKDEAA